MNDNIPVFAEDFIAIMVTEGEGLERVILQVSAEDADSGNNSQISYFLDEDNGGR